MSNGPGEHTITLCSFAVPTSAMTMVKSQRLSPSGCAITVAMTYTPLMLRPVRQTTSASSGSAHSGSGRLRSAAASCASRAAAAIPASTSGSATRPQFDRARAAAAAAAVAAASASERGAPGQSAEGRRFEFQARKQARRTRTPASAPSAASSSSSVSLVLAHMALFPTCCLWTWVRGRHRARAPTGARVPSLRTIPSSGNVAARWGAATIAMVVVVIRVRW